MHVTGRNRLGPTAPQASLLFANVMCVFPCCSPDAGPNGAVPDCFRMPPARSEYNVPASGWLMSKNQLPKPYSRILYFQARRAMLKAAEKQWEVPQHDQRPSPPRCSSPGDWIGNVERMFDSLPG